MQRQKSGPDTGIVGLATLGSESSGGAASGFPGGTLRAPVARSSPRNRQLDELLRILDARPQQFRLQFFAVASESGTTIVQETLVDAPDVETAARAVAMSPWPPRAIGLRLLDRDGREVFERLKADRL